MREELVRAALADYDETFSGGQGHGQERLSPEPAQSVKVRVRKGREIQILVISPLKMAIVLASFSALYGLQVVPHAILWCPVVNGGSLVVPGCCRGVVWWLYGPRRMLKKSFKKGVFGPLEGVWGFLSMLY